MAASPAGAAGAFVVGVALLDGSDAGPVPAAFVAVTVNVRVTVQPLVASACDTLTVGVPQLSVAVTNALTLVSVGGFVGLQPKLLPVGTVTTGAVVSAVQV